VVEQFRTIVLYAVNQWRRRGDNQLFFRCRHEETFQAPRLSLVPIHPIFRRALIENYRHAIVNRSYQPVGLGRDDGERPLPLSGLCLPRLVQAGKEKQSTVRRMYPDRLTLSLWTTPLVEAIRWDCAATLQERFSEGSAFVKRLRFGVDALAGPAVVAGPGIDQAQLASRAVRRSYFEVTMKC
jgi:hypothetical protein